ncbi:MAG: 50S ribosomal protein L22 [Oscillospiraceae bacterium]|nr:50S ribosomal protein L22 [Oscillospiraceae bacterium]
MEARAQKKFVRISPRKVVIVCDLIRGKDTKTAAAILRATPKAASEHLLKLLNSAVANAENNHNMDPDNLYVSDTFANPGPIIKRIRPVSRGRAHRINKRTSHITVAVAEKD